MLFPDFYGNDQLKATLSGLVDSGHFPHAILIDGPKGTGKKTLAKIIAAAAVCEGNGEKPCLTCRQCKNALSGNHPDIKLYEGEGATHSFKVDLVRTIRLDAFVKPNDAKRKVYILCDVENMTEQAQNALLKILEEPPETVIFILTCDLRSHVLETVLSRTQCLGVSPCSEKECEMALLKRCENIDPDEAKRAARISGGNIGRAHAMLDEGFSEIAEFVSKSVKALCSSDVYSFVRLSGVLEKNKELFESYLEILPVLLRDALAIKNSSSKTLSGFDEEAKMLARKFTANKLYEAQLASLDSIVAASQNANPTLHLTTLFSRLWRLLH